MLFLLSCSALLMISALQVELANVIQQQFLSQSRSTCNGKRQAGNPTYSSLLEAGPPWSAAASG
jgi:hypothetical protein